VRVQQCAAHVKERVFEEFVAILQELPIFSWRASSEFELLGERSTRRSRGRTVKVVVGLSSQGNNNELSYIPNESGDESRDT